MLGGGAGVEPVEEGVVLGVDEELVRVRVGVRVRVMVGVRVRVRVRVRVIGDALLGEPYPYPYPYPCPYPYPYPYPSPANRPSWARRCWPSRAYRSGGVRVRARGRLGSALERAHFVRAPEPEPLTPNP